VIETRSKHRDGPARFERAAMRCGIHTAREAAHDGDATRGEIGAYPSCRFKCDRGCGARSDDGDRVGIERIELASIPDRRRTISDRTEQRGKPRVEPWKDMDAAPRRLLTQFSRLVEHWRGAFEQLGIVGVKAFGQPDAG
jgi:hypothetical protein